MNPVVLAFVGDAAYTLLVRTELAQNSAAKANELNRKAAEIVSAHGQSGALERMLPLLTEEEEAVYRRGRNAKRRRRARTQRSPTMYARRGLRRFWAISISRGRRSASGSSSCPTRRKNEDGRQERRFRTFEDG